MIINPNSSSQISLNDLRAKATLSKSLARVASEGKVRSPVGAASAPAVALDLSRQALQIEDTRQQVGSAISFTQTQNGCLQQMSDAFDRMSQLAGLAQDPTISDTDRSRYQSEFSRLSASVGSAATKDFNGTGLFSGNSLEVPVDADGNRLTLPGVDLSSVGYSQALSGNLNSPSAAQDAFDKVNRAITRLSQDRAAVGSNQSRLNSAADRLTVGQENLNAVASRIPDAWAAEESTLYAQQRILAQPDAAMLAQANALPQSALRLLP